MESRLESRIALANLACVAGSTSGSSFKRAVIVKHVESGTDDGGSQRSKVTSDRIDCVFGIPGNFANKVNDIRYLLSTPPLYLYFLILISSCSSHKREYIKKKRLSNN